MPTCPACSQRLPTDDVRFCPSCGTQLTIDDSATPTALAPSEVPSRSYSSSTLHASQTSSGGRFPAGTVIGDRFRIIGLLGRGGMGEVYSADDLTLGQTVALKFLPEAMARDIEGMDRFLGEVRVARQVAHPNVCRVYDIGTVDGHHFITMELIDGDDLKTLLKQVGRFPQDKALELARQLCAGLAAAHDRGIIHRDLKPANIMIDGEGALRVTDFGLASIAGTVEGGEILAGTPTYMAPEQLAGREVTTASDIYALGLVLYELFTGRRARDASTLAELRSLDESALTHPTAHVSNLDSAIEGVILRCLKQDPSDRPATPLEVSAALPGGDPLAAALAAGETPSPRLVAAAGDDGVLTPKMAGACVALSVVLLVVVYWSGLQSSISGMVEFDRSPHYLIERAKEIVTTYGKDLVGVDQASGVLSSSGYIRYQKEKDTSESRWEDLRAERVSTIGAWYRQSPENLRPRPGFTVVGASDPPLQRSGEALALLDHFGRLRRLVIVPPQFVDTNSEQAESPSSEVVWADLFEEAGFEFSAFRAVAPEWTPPFHCDRRFAWEGPDPRLPDATFRVEAGSFGSRVVVFRVISPWTRPERMGTVELTATQKLGQYGGMAVMILMLVIAIAMARRNLESGRGDRRGAFRLSFWFLVIHSIVWFLSADHSADLGLEWATIQLDIGYNLFLTGMIWLMYIALEPYVRRRWPDTLISWTRLLGGRFRDPLVGHHVLLGVTCGLVSLNVAAIEPLLAMILDWPPVQPDPVVWPDGGLPETVASILDKPVHALLESMQALLLLLLLGVVLRRRKWAMAAGTVLFAALSLGGNDHPFVIFPFMVVAIGLFYWVMAWRGLLAAAVALSVVGILSGVPYSTNLSAWYSQYTLVALGSIVALLAYGYRVSTAGQPLVRDDVLAGFRDQD